MAPWRHNGAQASRLHGLVHVGAALAWLTLGFAPAAAEPVVLGPVRAPRATSPDPRPLAPTRPVKEPSLPLDEDQFDIPTFLRRQGQGDF